MTVCVDDRVIVPDNLSRPCPCVASRRVFQKLHKELELKESLVLACAGAFFIDYCLLKAIREAGYQVARRTRSADSLRSFSISSEESAMYKAGGQAA